MVRALSVKAHYLVVLGGATLHGESLGDEFLDKLSSRGPVLDQHHSRAMGLGLLYE